MSATSDLPLPTLSRSARTLLNALLDSSLSLQEIAEKQGIDDLLEIVGSPAIRAALLAIADFNDLRAAAIASPARIGVLQTLSEIASASPNLLERRRAASAFLRSVADRGPSRRSITPGTTDPGAATALPSPEPPAAKPTPAAPASSPAARSAPASPPLTASIPAQPHGPVPASLAIDLDGVLAGLDAGPPVGRPRPRKPTPAFLATAAGAAPS